MKLLLENWREYLANSERREKAQTEFDALLVKSRAIRDELGHRGWKDWLKDLTDKKTALDLFYAASTETPKRDKPHSVRIKQIYKKYADRAFLDTLTIVHWVESENLQQYLDTGKEHQTSAEAYLPTSIIEPHWGWEGLGVQIKGWVVIGSNENLFSGVKGYKAQRGKEESGYVKDAGSGNPNILIFDKETFIKNSGKNAKWRAHTGANNEFIVDNWRPMALVIVGGKEHKDFDKILQIAQQNNLPIVDENQNPIEMEDSNETPT